MLRWRRKPSALRHDLVDDHVVLSLVEGGRRVRVAEWSARLGSTAVSRLLVRAEDEQPATDGSPLVELGEDAIRLHPEAVAALSTSEAEALGLPPTAQLALDLASRGLVSDSDFRVESRWVRPGGAPVRANVRGPFLDAEGQTWRIPEPLFSLWRQARELAEPMGDSDRFAAMARLKEGLPEDSASPVAANAYLADTRVHFASGFSLSLGRTGAFDFDPVLFGKAATAAAAEGEATLDEAADSVLPPAAQKLFSEDRFRRRSEAMPVYVLRTGEYVFIDPALRPALSEVRRLQDAPEAERRSFLANPRRLLKERLGAEVAERTGLDALFIETEQFSARVAGVDLWRQQVLPWIKSQPNSWLPEKFGLRIGQGYYSVRPEDVGELKSRIDSAADCSAETVPVGGLLHPEQPDLRPPDVIPMTDQVRQAVHQLDEITREFAGLDGEEPGPKDATADEPPSGPEKLFLTVRENFEEVDYARAGATGELAASWATPALPARVSTSLKAHQVDGFSWLAHSHSSGRPGALLADDMGLGKTLQAICFMAWLREQDRTAEQDAPFLVVAPTGLLENWRSEIRRHLKAPLLGQEVLAFGSGLKLLAEGALRGTRDTTSGRAGLDAGDLTRAGVVLTTYETLRDYHFSFARIPFGLIVFDEIQKLKNPTSQVTRAAKTLNGAFTLGLSGTPVENRLQDLWSIVDVVSPGFLGSARDFAAAYPEHAPDKMKQLKARLCDPQDGRPPLMLRRMKADHLEGLPEKIEHKREIAMPEVQASAYADLVRRGLASRGVASARGGMLELLHAMRGVSLHPADPASAPADLAAYAADSARLVWTLEILDQVERAREQALVFVESLAMQEVLAALIAKRYRLPAPPLRINGAVAGPKRQDLVDRFQRRAGNFDVMILSPKAGGVGLTLTAANHVIHLSRWWNPAVEDQSTDRCYRIGQTKTVHVYLPLAVHPDPVIGPSSFDLKLDALLDRKRMLSREMLAPPDGGAEDAEELFTAVTSLGGAATAQPGAAEVARTTAKPENAGEQPPEQWPNAGAGSSAGQPAERGPGPISEIRRFDIRVKSGQARPIASILREFTGRTLTHVKIVDPYALADPDQIRAQVEFLRELARVASVGRLDLEYDPSRSKDSDAQSRDAFRRLLQVIVGVKFPKPGFVPRRSQRGDDFHDRVVRITASGTGRFSEIVYELRIGRGLIGLMNERFECNGTFTPIKGVQAAAAGQPSPPPASVR